MQIFLDTANVDEIREMAELGLIDGVTTNPSLMAKEGRTDYRNVVREVCYLVQGPISAEVTSPEAAGMIEETREIANWSPHVVVKVPFNREGLKTMGALRSHHADPDRICQGCPWLGECDTPLERAQELVMATPVRFNVTLIFSANQALLAAKAGAAYVSPFIGRLDDVGHDGMEVIREIRDIFDNYAFETQILTASARHPRHLTEAAVIGSDVITLPYGVLQKAMGHPLTDKGQAVFLADWEAVRKELANRG
jgi:transaldolase